MPNSLGLVSFSSADGLLLMRTFGSCNWATGGVTANASALCETKPGPGMAPEAPCLSTVTGRAGTLLFCEDAVSEYSKNTPTNTHITNNDNTVRNPPLDSCFRITRLPLNC